MVSKEDIEITKDLATIQEWRKGVDKVVDSYSERIGDLERWQQNITGIKPYILPLMAIGAIVASAIVFVGFFVLDPATAREIFKSFVR